MASMKRYEKFYDTYIDIMDAKTSVTQERARIIRPYLKKYIKSLGGRTLDLCCGTGIYSFVLEQMEIKVTGIDFQKSMLSKSNYYARQSGSDIDFVLGDVRILSFRDEYFDSVIALGNVIPCFTLSDFEKVAKDVFRVLKPHGRFVIEYMDMIYTFIEEYKRVLYEKSEKGDVFSFHGLYDADHGTITRIYLNLTTKESFDFNYAIWAPWILRHMLKVAGFRLEDTIYGLFGYPRLYPRRTIGYIDVFRKEPNSPNVQ